MTTNGDPADHVRLKRYKKCATACSWCRLGISGSPSADWRRLFYDAQQEVPAGFSAAFG